VATFLELYGEELTEALSSSDTSLIFTTARRKSAINRGQRWFAEQTSCLVRTASITLVDSTDEYDLETEIADEDFLWLVPQGVRVKIVSGSTTTFYAGKDFTRRTLAWLDANSPGWRTAADGRPCEWYERTEGGERFWGMTPAPDISGGDTWTALLPYAVKPEPMVADADEPFTVDGDALAILIPWHDALVHYAASKLELLRKDIERSQYFMGLAQQRVLDYRDKNRPVGGRQVTFKEHPYNRVGVSRGAGSGYEDTV
jgi:hypothetical protein